jgi:hypothetical protein
VACSKLMLNARSRIHLGREPDQAVGLTERGDAFAAARRAHRRDPAPGAGFTDHQVAEIHDSGALEPPRKQAAE